MNPNSLYPDKDHQITLAQAIEMTTLYRQQKEIILAPAYQQSGILAISETFNREAFDALLAQEGCKGIRIYYGMDPTLRVHAILCGVNAAGNDMIGSGSQAGEGVSNFADGGDDEGLLFEESTRCPDICADPSPLNP
ncbi:MAG: hypothetical protein V4722_06810 [Bacteroidota bacterium]